MPFADKPGGMLMYENDAGERITVLVGTNPAGTETGFRVWEEEGVVTFYWTEDQFSYAMSGAVDRSTLLALAHMLYAQS